MRQPYVTIDVIVKTYGIHLRTARRWAAEDRWRRTGTRPVRYHLADAQASYEARRTGRIERHLAQRHAPA